MGASPPYFQAGAHRQPGCQANRGDIAWSSADSHALSTSGDKLPEGLACAHGLSIVLFGATGYTGRLTAEALVKRGATPVLAGRNEKCLKQMAEGLGDGLETAFADVGKPETVRALLRAGDVMLSTVGPFTRWGDPAAEAAIDARAAYIDSTGEPAFIHKVFTEFGPRAKEAGIPMITAAGYDWVPGNLAAALALSEAGDQATKVQIGYFILGKGETNGLSGGHHGQHNRRGAGAGLRVARGAPGDRAQRQEGALLEVKGRRRPAISSASSEHFTIPRLFKQVTDGEPFLGWFGSMSRPLQVSSAGTAAMTKIPGTKTGMAKLIGRFAKGSSGGPDEDERSKTGSHILAIARNEAGDQLSEVHLDGVNGYTFTAEFLAWAAICGQQGRIKGSGALGPAEAFTIEGLTEGAASAGIKRAQG